MSYKIVVDSCCELPEEYLQDPRFEIVPLGLEVGDYQIQDDENFDQAEFLKKVAECPKCPKSACPSPERFREAYHTEAEHVYVITLSSHLSGSYNSTYGTYSGVEDGNFILPENGKVPEQGFAWRDRCSAVH